MHHVGRKATAGQKPHLPRAAGGVGRHAAEFAGPDGAGALQLGLAQLACGVGVQRHAVLGEFLAHPGGTVAGGAQVHARGGKARVAEVALVLQPRQQRFHVVAFVGAGGKLAAHFGHAVLALREQGDGAGLEGGGGAHGQAIRLRPGRCAAFTSAVPT